MMVAVFYRTRIKRILWIFTDSHIICSKSGYWISVTSCCNRKISVQCLFSNPIVDRKQRKGTFPQTFCPYTLNLANIEFLRFSFLRFSINYRNITGVLISSNKYITFGEVFDEMQRID